MPFCSLKITKNCLLFSLFFPWHFTLKHASTVYNKHGKISTQTSKGAFYEIFPALWEKIRPCLSINFFDTRGFLKHQKGSFHNFFLTRIFSTSLLWYPHPPLWFIQIDKWAAPTLSCSQFVYRVVIFARMSYEANWFQMSVIFEWMAIFEFIQNSSFSTPKFSLYGYTLYLHIIWKKYYTSIHYLGTMLFVLQLQRWFGILCLDPSSPTWPNWLSCSSQGSECSIGDDDQIRPTESSCYYYLLNWFVTALDPNNIQCNTSLGDYGVAKSCHNYFCPIY